MSVPEFWGILTQKGGFVMPSNDASFSAFLKVEKFPLIARHNRTKFGILLLIYSRAVLRKMEKLILA